MSPRWDELWPAPEPPDGFALRVLVKSVQLQPRPKRWLRVALAALVPCLCLAVAFSLSLFQQQRESARMATILETQRRETEERLRRLQSDFETANRREQELQASLANAKDEATRAKLQTELESVRSKSSARSSRPTSGHIWAPAGKKSCAPGDPLCD